jgi:hypothetical protein
MHPSAQMSHFPVYSFAFNNSRDLYNGVPRTVEFLTLLLFNLFENPKSHIFNIPLFINIFYGFKSLSRF